MGHGTADETFLSPFGETFTARVPSGAEADVIQADRTRELGVVDVSDQPDECIYPKTEEVLRASPDDMVFDAVFLVDFQPDDSGNVPINLYAISEAHGLQVTEHEVEEDDQGCVALTVRGTVKSIRALSAELDHPPDVLKRVMPAVSTTGRDPRSHSSRLTVSNRSHESR
jgi:hypothetical protein